MHACVCVTQSVHVTVRSLHDQTTVIAVNCGQVEDSFEVKLNSQAFVFPVILAASSLRWDAKVGV